MAKEEKDIEIEDHEETIKTPVDMLLDYLKKVKETRSDQAAKALGLTVEQIEEWADVLEEHDLAEIGYSPLKGMIISVKTPAKVEGEEEVKEEVKEKFKAPIKVKRAPGRRFSKLFERLRKRPAVAKLKTKKVEKFHVHITDRYNKAAAKLNNLKATKEIIELKKKKEELSKQVQELTRQVKEISRASPEEVKKPRFFDYVRETEKQAKKLKEEADTFADQIESLEKTMIEHRKKH